MPIDEAGELPHLAAASNWHALAQFACRFVGEQIGAAHRRWLDHDRHRSASLTDESSRAERSDTERLLAGELVYTGVGRTPVCAVTRSLAVSRRSVSQWRRVFATTADAYVMLGEIAEQPEATWTADGRPLTRDFARERLARMICADAHDV